MSFVRAATLAAAFISLSSLAIAQAPAGGGMGGAAGTTPGATGPVGVVPGASPANPSSTMIPSHPCTGGATAMGDTDVNSSIAPPADQTGQPSGIKGNTGTSESASKSGSTDPTVGSHAISGSTPSKMTQTSPSGGAC